MRGRFPLAVLSAAVALAGPLRAQFHFSRSGPNQYEELGHSVACVGDVDGDGFDDVAAGAPGVNQTANSSGLEEYVEVYSGRNGSTIHRITRGPGASKVYFGFSVAGPGDVDGDGVPDIAVGLYDFSAMAVSGYDVYSGANASLIHDVREAGSGAHALAAVGDLDGDGVRDLVLGNPRYMKPGVPGINQGIVRVYSGKTGSRLVELPPGNWADSLGTSVACAGDVNGDGTQDLIVGAPGFDLGAAGVSEGAAYVYCGASQALLYRFTGVAQGDELGASVAGLGDVNGDGYPDLAAGAPATHPISKTDSYARVYSGLDGSLLYHLTTDPFLDIGASVAGPGDMSGDGIPDIAVGSERPNTGSSRADVFSGADGSPLVSLFGYERMGELVAPAGDVNGDGYRDLLLARHTWSNLNGRVDVFLGGPVLPYCRGKVSSSGCRAFLTTSGSPVVGSPNSFLVTANNVVNQRPGLLFWGLASKVSPFKGGSLCVRAPLVRTPVQNSGGNPPPDDCSGALTFDFTDAYAASKGLAPGVRVYAQYFYVDQGYYAGAGLSDAVTFLLLP